MAEITVTGTSKATPRPWRWHESTCTHGGYGRCREGCRRSGFWAYNPAIGNETWLGELLMKADIPLVLKAVNAYDAMRSVVEAARKISPDIYRRAAAVHGRAGDADALATALAALVAVEGKETKT